MQGPAAWETGAPGAVSESFGTRVALGVRREEPVLQRSGPDHVALDICFDDILLLGHFFLELWWALSKAHLYPGRPIAQGTLHGSWSGKARATYSPH